MMTMIPSSLGFLPKASRAHLGAVMAAAAISFAAGIPTGAAAQSAESYPEEQVRLVIPYSPGGATDIIFRLVAQEMEADLGEPVVVINMPGASTTLGSREVRDADPDGYTILGSHDTIATAYISGVVDYSFEAFIPIALVTQTPNMAAINADLGIESLDEFRSYLMENPGELAWGITPGSTSHFFAVMMMDAMGVPEDALRLITYEGTGDSMAGVMRGEIAGTMVNVASAKSMFEEGTFVPLAVAHPDRLPQLPETPTFMEQGYDMVHSTSRGLFAPLGTPDPIIARLAEAAEAVTASADFNTRIENDLGSVVKYLPSEEFETFVTDLQAKLSEIAERVDM